MTPKYLQTEAAGRDRWMISYMDVLTILLIFFIAVASRTLPLLQATPPTPVLPAPPAPLAAVPISQPVPLAPVSEARPDLPRIDLLRIKERLEQRGLDLRMEPRGLVISLPQTVLYPSGEDRIIPEALPIVSEIADVLRDVPNRVSLVGHADSVPIHNRRFKNNWELSAARGLQLLTLLSGTYGIQESRLSVASDGSYRPIGPNDTPDGRASNRRVEIVILEEPGAVIRDAE